MSDKSLRNSCNSLYCTQCDYLAKRKGDFKKHLLTKKHTDTKKVLADTIAAQKGTSKRHICKCGKEYAHHTGLSRHKKTCDFKEGGLVPLPTDDKAFQVLLVNTLKEILPQLMGTHNTVNNTVNNNNCNNRISANQINVFLNEKCGEAMTIQDFARNLQFSMSDLLLNKQDSLIKVINQNLVPLGTTERPVHCSNIAKRKWHVNDEDDGWKTDDGTTMLTEVQCKLIKKWSTQFEKETPGWRGISSKEEEYIKIVNRTSSQLEPNAAARVLTHLGEDIFIGKLELTENKN